MTSQKIPGIYAIPPYPGWNNQQLTKNCGIVPYLFHKKYGFRAVMAGCKIEESYPYLDAYVPGLEMDFLPDAHTATRLQYIQDHAADMDILCLHGPYTSYLPLVRRYRELRPDGRIYMELDPNSAWMDRILWDTPEFRELLDSCTVIGASSKKMQRHLSRKWPYIIEYLPNGWYNYTGQDTIVDFSKKENTILTVGRIGTYPKQNHILLNAFASIKDQLPDWALKLVGPINEAFIPFVEEFFQHNPDLNRRVVFTGAITDKEKLMCEYAQAKIFAMTSSSEGGTPNVIAEALFSGCYIITSDIDGAIDCTDNGACGSVFPIDNVEALSQQLLAACQSPARIEQCGQHALRYASTNFDFEHIVERLHYLLYGGSAS